MPAASYLQTSFLGGKWSPSAQGRADEEAYATALNESFNALSLEAGAQEVRDTVAEAHAHGREIGVYCNGYVVCRKTRKEAEDYHRYYAEEMGDWAAVKLVMTGTATTAAVVVDDLVGSAWLRAVMITD